MHAADSVRTCGHALLTSRLRVSQDGKRRLMCVLPLCAKGQGFSPSTPAVPHDAASMGSLDDGGFTVHRVEPHYGARHAVSEEEELVASSSETEPSPPAPSRRNLKIAGTVVSVAGLLALIGTGLYYGDSIRDFLVYFSTVVDDWGPLGVLAYFGLYTVLEVLAVPAIPLTMTAGAIFGIVPGTLVTSLAGTVAATISFLIARYLARDRFLGWASKRKEFRAVDKAIGENGFKVVTLLRLSPLLPLAASNYFYGLTSVSLPAYILGSWVGMIPGTLAYVSAGHVSKLALVEGGELPISWWQIAIAVGISAIAIGYIGSLAKKALKEVDDDMESVEQPLGSKDIL